MYIPKLVKQSIRKKNPAFVAGEGIGIAFLPITIGCGVIPLGVWSGLLAALGMWVIVLCIVGIASALSGEDSVFQGFLYTFVGFPFICVRESFKVLAKVFSMLHSINYGEVFNALMRFRKFIHELMRD